MQMTNIRTTHPSPISIQDISSWAIPTGAVIAA